MADCLSSYLRCADRNDDVLIGYAETLGNGAVFKRLGFLAEEHPDAAALAEACRVHLTNGNAKLDPSLECSRLISKWRLWVPPNWATGRAHD